MKNKVTWSTIQPLTGGAYYAGENLFGPAQWILSYPGLEAIERTKTGDIRGMGNERHFLEHLKKNKRSVPYIQFKHGMFEFPDKVELVNNEEYGNSKFSPDSIYSNPVDIINAVPVCSGLSSSNLADHKKADCEKNNNMKFITEFALSKLKPKVFVFENAPNLYTNRGKTVRGILNNLAYENGYSVTYIKTNTKWHNNIQHRERTFIVFWQWLNNKPMPPPAINPEHAPIESFDDYMNLIPKNATQNGPEHEMNAFDSRGELNFIRYKYGAKWREIMGYETSKTFIIKNNLVDEFLKFENNPRTTASYERVLDKLKQGLGYMDRSFFVMRPDRVKTVFHAVTYNAIHPYEDRTYRMREWAHLMGMPHDWEYLHEPWSFGAVIGQNVPVKTFEYIMRECGEVVADWQNKRIIHPNGPLRLRPTNSQSNVFMFHNIHPERSNYDE